MNELHLLGMALGTSHSPKSWQVPPHLPPLSGAESANREDLKVDFGSLDRHELAHVFIRQFVSAFARPPDVFIEGWAMSFAGLDPCWLTQSALIDKGRVPSFSQLFGSKEHYFRRHSELYNYYGAIVQFLIDKYGYQKFLNLYQTISYENALYDLESISKMHLGELEAQFWTYSSVCRSGI